MLNFHAKLTVISHSYARSSGGLDCILFLGLSIVLYIHFLLALRTAIKLFLIYSLAALPLRLRVGTRLTSQVVRRHTKLGHVLILLMLRRKYHLVLGIRMHHLFQLDSLRSSSSCNDSLLLHLQFEYLLRLEFFVHLNFLLHHDVALSVFLSTLNLLVTIHDFLEQSLLLAYSLYLRELLKLLLLFLVISLHSLLLEVFPLLSLVLESEVLLQLEELTSNFLLAVL